MSEAPALMYERDLVCTDCGLIWQVFEVPARHINPARYRCGPCMQAGYKPATRPTERELRNAREARGGAVADALAVHGQDRDFPRQPGRGKPYDPRTAAIPF